MTLGGRLDVLGVSAPVHVNRTHGIEELVANDHDIVANLDLAEVENVRSNDVRHLRCDAVRGTRIVQIIVIGSRCFAGGCQRRRIERLVERRDRRRHAAPDAGKARCDGIGRLGRAVHLREHGTVLFRQ